ncbi:MAG: hypothetical protein WAO78_01175 [Roseovarius sp.]
MARRFLTHLDMNGNQILNASFEKLTTANEPTTGLFEGRIYYNTDLDILKVYDGTQWVAVGAITNVEGTTNEIEVSVVDGVATVGLPTNIHVDVTGDLTGNADTASALATARNIAISGPISGNANFDGSGDITITVAQGNDSVTLGTHTTGDYVATVSGTANEIEVSGTGEGAAVTVGLPNDVIIGNDLTVSNDLVVTGDLTVNGTTTTVNTETVNIADNIITLNSNYDGSSPTENAGIEVERGTVDENVVLRWNETLNTWEATRDGITYYEIVLAGDDISVGDITDFQEEVEDVVGGLISGTNSISVDYVDGSNSLTIDTTLAATSYLDKTNGLAVDISTLETKLVTDSFTKKVSADVGDNSATSFQITHNLGTIDVVVNIYDKTTFDTVEADVVRTDTNNVTVSFNVAPALNEFRAVIIG